MFEVVSGISLLDRKELISLILATHFRFLERTPEEKLAVTKELKKLVIYLFRDIIIKGQDDGVLRGIRTKALEMINSDNPFLFKQETDSDRTIIKEFQYGTELFYQKL